MIDELRRWVLWKLFGLRSPCRVIGGGKRY
jgi:hypothetical protein